MRRAVSGVAAVAMIVLALPLAAGAQTPPEASGPVYENPVHDPPDVNAADPDVVFLDGVYYMYPTGTATDYRVWTSTDLVHWEEGPVVFDPDEPNVWAPDLFHDTGTNTFYLYYTVDERIGVATADSPLGPFTTVVDTLLDDAIDAHLFQDDDASLYLYYTQVLGDANVDGFNSVWVQPMASFTDEADVAPTKVVSAHSTDPQNWKFPIAEAPWMLKRDGTYYLMYSGFLANSARYAIGYATSTSPTGPFAESPRNPIASAHDDVYGPGHHAVVTDGAGQMWMLYHQKQTDEVGFDRFVALDRLWFEDDELFAETTRGGPKPGPSFPDRGTDETVLQTTLTGARVVGPDGRRGAGDPDGIGAATVRVRGTQMCVSLELADIDLPAAAAELRRGGKAAGGPVVLALPAPGTDGRSEACIDSVDPDLVAEVTGSPGDFFVEVTTAAFGDGAVRGNLQPAGSEGELLATSLHGDTSQHGDASGGEGAGTATLSVRPEERTVCFGIAVTGVELPASGAELRSGADATEGLLVAALRPPDDDGIVGGCVRSVPTPALERLVEHPASYHVVVHTPSGQLRGELAGADQLAG